MRSMTGFGRGIAALGDGRIILELKTVNHRFLDIRTRLPRELTLAEGIVERLLRKHLSRGHCTVSMNYESSDGDSNSLNIKNLEGHINRLSKLAKSKGLETSILLPVLANAPDLYTEQSFTDLAALETAATEAFDEAIARLIEMRENEGAAMKRELDQKVDDIIETANSISNLAVDYAPKIFEKTRARIKELLVENGLGIDKARVEAEAALLADKADINEEITRLRSHCEQMRLLMAMNEPIGRRLEFLAQEMGREANTIGSKAAFADLAHQVIQFKADLEKIRELVQNIE